jgi:hypothetical protein
MRECTFCRKQVPSHLRICPNCGNVLVGISIPGAIEPQTYQTRENEIEKFFLASDGMPYTIDTPESVGTLSGGKEPGIREAQPYGYNTLPYSQPQLPSYSQTPLSYYRAPGPTVMQQPRQSSHSALSKGMMTLLVSFALLIMLSGVGLILYASVIHPAQLYAQATATVQSVQTVNAYVTTTAQVQATTFAAATATVQRQGQATATALQNLYVQSTSGTPILNETLATQTSSNWDVYSAVGGGGCAFAGGALFANVSQQHFYVPCFAHATNFSNFAFEARINIIKGDEAGLVFRANDASSKFYVFRIGRDGNYALYISKDDKSSVPIAEDSSSAIKTGPGQMNTLTVIAQNGNIYMYINKQFTGSVNDGTYASGEIGVFAGDNTNATEVAFSNVRIWNL